MIGRMLAEARAGFRRGRPEDPLGRPDAPSSLMDALRLVLPHAKRHWRTGLPALSLSLVSVALGYAVPFATRSLIDDAVMAGNASLLPSRLAVLGGLGLVLLVVGSLSRYASTLFSGSATVDLQDEMIRRTMSLPVRLFGEERSGYLLSRVMGDIQGVSWFLSGSSVNLAASVVRVSAGIALMIGLEPRLGLACIPFVAVLFVASVSISHRLRNLGLHSMEENARVSRDLQEILSSGTVIRAFAAEGRAAGRVSSGLSRLLGVMMERTASGSAAGILLDLVPGAAKLFAAGAGAYLVTEGSMTLGSLAAFLSMLGSTMGPARQAASTAAQIPQSLASVDRIRALMERAGEEPAGSTAVERLAGEIEFRDVSFAYDDGRPVLSNLSFRVAPGGRMAVTGGSGEGKTTLLMLLLGFYRPCSGEILLDGVPLDSLDIRAVRARIGFVPQEASIMAGTILDNLALGAPGLGAARALEVCMNAGVDFVNEPGDLETVLGEGGFGLSTGQRQRLAIARALAPDPDVLLMDEPTSALDAASEEATVSVLANAARGRTTVFVTHSPGVLELADSILVLEGSRGRQAVPD